MAVHIPPEFIQELLSRVDIVEVIDQRVPLKKTGKSWVACCPFHDEKTPSFNVSATKQLYYCFGCSQGGDVIKFLIDYDRVTFVEAVEELAQHTGMELVRTQSDKAPIRSSTTTQVDLYQLLAQVTRYFQAQFKQSKEAGTAIEYLQQRGISGEIAKTYQLGFAASGWDNLLKAFPGNAMRDALVASGMVIHNEQGRYYDRYRHRIMFPILDRRGRVVGFGGRVIDNEDSPKYLNSPETAIFHKSRELYGLYQILATRRSPDDLLVVEGYMDVIGLVQHGIDNAVAALGTAISATHIQLLTRHTRRIIFCMDGDTAGRQAAWRALELALPIIGDDSQVRFLFLPQSEDPDSLIRQEGAEAFSARINKAQSLTNYLFEQLLQTVDIQQMEGKAQLIMQLGRLLKNMTAQALRQLIIERLAQLVHMPMPRIMALMQTEADAATTPYHTPKTLTPMRSAIALLIQQPSLARYVDLQTLQIHDAGGELFSEIVTFIQQHPNMNTQGLLHRWQDLPEGRILLKLATWERAIPDSGIEDEFIAVLQRLGQESLQRQTNELLAKARQQQLTAAQQTQLQQLLRQLKGGGK
jgi:DNA primase